MRTVGDAERRARLATRQALHPDHHAPDVVGAARSVVCLHATEAATVHLAVGARTTGVTPFDVDSALYDDRSIVKQLAMRRTLFAFPRDLLPAALAVARERIAPEQHRLVSRDAARHGIADDGEAWLATAGAAVERRLAGGEALTAATLRAELPELTGAITVNEGKRYGGTFNLFHYTLPKLGVEVSFVDDPEDLDSWQAAIKDNTRALYGETISNPNNEILDVPGIAEVAHRNGLPLIVDNTVATPYLLNPLKHGADIVVPDLRGHGESALFDSYGDEQTAADLVAIIEHLGSAPALVVGTSMSAAAAVIAAVAWSLVFLTTSGTVLVSTPRETGAVTAWPSPTF